MNTPVIVVVGVLRVRLVVPIGRPVGVDWLYGYGGDGGGPGGDAVRRAAVCGLEAWRGGDWVAQATVTVPEGVAEAGGGIDVPGRLCCLQGGPAGPAGSPGGAGVAVVTHLTFLLHD